MSLSETIRFIFSLERGRNLQKIKIVMIFHDEIFFQNLFSMVRPKLMEIKLKNSFDLFYIDHLFGNPLQYSCLENPMDGGAWQATVHSIAESDATEVT